VSARLGLALALLVALAASACVAVAGALAFGLGNRELAGRVTRDWYERRSPQHRKFEPTTFHAEDEHEPLEEPKH